MTVEVETPEGLATGTGVVETHFRPRNELVYTMDSDQRWVIGEAIAVDVPGGVVFALLNSGGDYGFYRPNMNFGWAPGPDGQRRRAQFYASEQWWPDPDGRLRPVRLAALGEKTPERKTAWSAVMQRRDRSRAEIDQALNDGGSFSLLEEGWPRFVFLPDSSDLKNAVFLSPTETHEAAIGDIRVRRIVVQETEDPVTRTPAAYHPWRAAKDRILNSRPVYPPQISADLVLDDEFSTLLE